MVAVVMRMTVSRRRVQFGRRVTFGTRFVAADFHTHRVPSEPATGRPSEIANAVGPETPRLCTAGAGRLIGGLIGRLFLLVVVGAFIGDLVLRLGFLGGHHVDGFAGIPGLLDPLTFFFAQTLLSVLQQPRRGDHVIVRHGNRNVIVADF